ncbi:GGDEF domain-containing protein [Falsochrobactrum shanghaiense]|uniref:diguanylate cyclase n=1 Tax=Falsochrobactrum shanghaiense TaxID=2201899 RepID=A0A316J9N0_9HYPH|nr:GGDEF domain-containing protein [Falsochrobactrum shanghaiense]
MDVPSNPLVLIGPSILLVFALYFLAFWMSDKRRRHLLFFAVAVFLFCLGALSQMLKIPFDQGINALVSAFVYTLSVLLLCDGLLRRSGKRISGLLYCVALFFVVGGIAYYFYVERNLFVRIYILNFGIGLIFLFTLWQLHMLRRGSVPEKMLFWLLLAFTSQFFIRTGLTANSLLETPAVFSESQFWLILQFSLAVFGVAFALAILAVVVSDKVSTLEVERAMDPMTGLLNRRGFTEQAERLMQNAQEAPLCLLAIDIDHFKRVNDSYGHPVGDNVIRGIGEIIKRVAGPAALCARLGGEEFAVLSPRTDLAAATQLANDIRATIRDASFAGIPATYEVTVSIGIKAAKSHYTLERLLLNSDEALYRAKRAGRDRVEA